MKGFEFEFSSGGIQAPDLIESAKKENESDEGIAREKLLSILEQGDYLERKEDLSIIDLEKIQQDKLWLKNSPTHLSASIQSGGYTAFDLLKDFQVVSRSDYEKYTDKTQLETKSLFNVPESQGSAFDLEKIRENNYYLNFWDMYAKGNIPWDRKIKARNGDKIDARDFYLATKIFHDYKGKRDKQGNLLVADNATGEYKKISNEWIKKNIGRIGGALRTKGIHKFLLEGSQNLQKNGLLSNKDFASQTTGATSELKRGEFFSNGGLMQVMINNVLYYIGKNNFIFEDKKIPLNNIKVVVLDNKTAGIVEILDNKEELRYTFDLLDDEEIAQKRKSVEDRYSRPLSRKEISNRSLIRKKELTDRMSPWRVTKDNPKRATETPESYAERIATLADYKFIGKITDDFIQNSEVPIHKELSWREQQWLAAAAYKLGVPGRYAKLLDFGKNYGSVGLKTFLSLELDQEMGDKILQIGERLDRETARLVFVKYAEIIQSVESIKDEIKNYSAGEKEISYQEIAESLLKEGKDVLTYFSNISAKKISPEEIQARLDRVNANVMLFGNIICQLPREEVANLDLKKISHIGKFENILAGEILNHPEILEQIKSIIRDQFPKNTEEENQTGKLEDDELFEKECRTNPNLRITLTLANNQILSFFTKEKKSENIDYVDWFIANPDAPIKGLGEATLRLGIEAESKKEMSYYAVAKPHVKSFQILVENLGFVAFQGSTENGEYKHHYARVRRFPTDTEFSSKKLPEEKKKIFFETLKNICSPEKSVQDMIFEGKAMRACKIEYHGQTHHDDIQKTDPDGWIMQEIDRQNANSYVLTRFIPENSNKDNQIFYAVFEKDSSPEELREELKEVVFGERSSHSDSKNTLSN